MCHPSLPAPWPRILQCGLYLVSCHGQLGTNAGTQPYGECVRASGTALQRVVSNIHYLVGAGITIKWQATHLIEEANVHAITSNKARSVLGEMPLEVQSWFEARFQHTHSVF